MAKDVRRTALNNQRKPMEASCVSCSRPLSRLAEVAHELDQPMRCNGCEADWQNEKRDNARERGEDRCDCGGRAARSTHGAVVVPDQAPGGIAATGAAGPE